MTIEEMENFDKSCYDFLANYVPFYKDKVFVTGGFFPRFYHKKELRDIDVFVAKDIYKDVVADYIKSGFLLTHESKYFAKFASRLGDDFTIDVIGFHKPNDITWINSFDFTICQYYLIENEIKNIESKSEYRQKIQSFRDIILKRLLFCEGAKIGSGLSNVLSRLLKYRDLGFHIEDHEVRKMLCYLVKLEDFDADFEKYNTAK